MNTMTFDEQPLLQWSGRRLIGLKDPITGAAGLRALANLRDLKMHVRLHTVNRTQGVAVTPRATDSRLQTASRCRLTFQSTTGRQRIAPSNSRYDTVIGAGHGDHASGKVFPGLVSGLRSSRWLVSC